MNEIRVLHGCDVITRYEQTSLLHFERVKRNV